MGIHQQPLSVLVRTRGDEIEAGTAKVRLNSLVLESREITGIRYGIKTAKPGGGKPDAPIWAKALLYGIEKIESITATKYRIEVSASGARKLEVDFKKIGRNDEECLSDFQTIVTALHKYIAPVLAHKLAVEILDGGGEGLTFHYLVGHDCSFLAQGMVLGGATHSSGPGWYSDGYEKSPPIAYEDIYSSRENNRIHLTYKTCQTGVAGQIEIDTLGTLENWNAPIIPEILESMLLIKQRDVKI